MEHMIENLKLCDTIYKFFINTIKLDTVNPFNKNTYINKTSLEKPLVFSTEIRKNGNTLYINPEFYRKNRKKVEELVKNTLKSTKKEIIRLLSKELITKDILESITENKNIKEVVLADSISISDTRIKKLMNSGITKLVCSTEYNDFKSFLRNYVKGVQINNLIVIQGMGLNNFGGDTVSLLILRELTKKQLQDLKTIFSKFPQNKVVLHFIEFKQAKEIIDAIKCNQLLIVNNKHCKKEHYEFFEKNFPHIPFEIDSDLLVSSKKLNEREEIYKLIINEVKNHNLTPLEEYMYLYNIVKLYKEYKEVPAEEHLMFSRESVFTLFNNYIVCVGYTNLLAELVERLNDPNLKVVEYGCRNMDKNGGITHHSRCLVKINDEKYGIFGTYVSDPTWDAVRYYYSYINPKNEKVIKYNIPLAHIDYYNHFLMTYEESKDICDEKHLDDATDVFYNNHKITSENHFDVYEIARNFIGRENVSSKEITNEISKMHQQEISGEIIASAVKQIYSKIFENDDITIQKMVDFTIKHNNSYQEEHFDKTRHKFNKVLKKELHF